MGDELSRLVGEKARAAGTIQKAQSNQDIVVTKYQVFQENFGEEAARSESPSS